MKGRLVADTDLIVVLPGIMGSTLRADGHLIWAPSAGTILRTITTFARSIPRYALPEDVGDEHPGDGVEPAGLMPDLHALPGLWTPVKGYDRLLAHLEKLGHQRVHPDPDAPPGNLLPVPYDWRLSNRYNARRLARIVEPALQRWRAQGGPYAEARLVFICHSMGGLIARWYLEHEGGAEVTRKLITLGTPYRGALKALDQLVNGVTLTLRLGRFGENLTAFARTLPSLHQLLPEYACIDRDGNLLKTTETPIPNLRTRALSDAMDFHARLHRSEHSRPASLTATHALLGTGQPTATTARLTPHGL